MKIYVTRLDVTFLYAVGKFVKRVNLTDQPPGVFMDYIIHPFNPYAVMVGGEKPTDHRVLDPGLIVEEVQILFGKDPNLSDHEDLQSAAIHFPTRTVQDDKYRLPEEPGFHVVKLALTRVAWYEGLPDAENEASVEYQVHEALSSKHSDAYPTKVWKALTQKNAKVFGNVD